ncbi:MAG: efflux RND transporter periplasmic adaptor subunit [Candidatus Eisenbacteria bacterium]|nr:efflux RND transporter periplasmic adaptor subunit [Candidatus Eisenbacteria bacterium]
MRHLSTAALCLALLLGGCSPKGGQDAGPSPAPQTAGAPTTTGSAAESGEAMCLEHGVLESVCTRCHPKLIPIFKAKGDWCAEHEFPESICPVCHPERAGKPTADVSTDEAPADGTRIRFKTLETARQAGIETVKAVDGNDEGVVMATARIVPDPARLARVNVTAPGVVRTLKADIGTRVSRGDPLVVIESAVVATDRARLESSQARVRAAEAGHQRETELHTKGISSLKEVQASRQELEIARADAAAAGAALGMVGASEGRSGTYVLRAPIGGIVTRRDASLGSLVDAEEVIFEIIDTSRLWAEIDIPELDASSVSAGQKVILQIEGVPDRSFEGTISYVAPMVDDRTRTVLARAALDNPGGILRANVFARAQVLARTSKTTVLIPRAALHETKGVNLVFVRLREDEFITRRVKIGGTAGDLVAVNTGITSGEDIVTTGSFLLKTETLKGSIGAGCCEVEPPK